MNDEYWEAIATCNAAYDGVFFYGVKTTGIFCRPSCKSRTPKKENVLIFFDHHTPLDKGWRPCKRCRPDQMINISPRKQLVERTTEFLTKNFSRDLTLEEIAKTVYTSPFYLQRIFKEEMKRTPAQFVVEKRIDAAKEFLMSSSLSITAISYEVGFKSPSHFATIFRKVTGFSPSDFRLTQIAKQKDS
jgi:AraC family transcriptional regulator of adaptative response / methylphosphotriester-DNA alkyltransferase methyltransferase